MGVGDGRQRERGAVMEQSRRRRGEREWVMERNSAVIVQCGRDVTSVRCLGEGRESKVYRSYYNKTRIKLSSICVLAI